MASGKTLVSLERSLVRSPLRYPGGKSRAVRAIVDMLPSGLTTLASPFTGGGSIELAVAKKMGARVYGYDVFAPLVSFWDMLLKNPRKLAEKVSEYHPLTRAQFYALQNNFSGMTKKLEIAATFFILNRASFSGTTLSGGMSPGHPRFTKSAINRIKNFKVDGFSVECADFRESIPKHSDDFLYLDPPYANGGALYGNKGDCHVDFEHEALADMLKKRDGWLLSYNDCVLVRKLYRGFTFVTPKWTYGMNSSKASNEVLILSRDF